MLLSGISSIPDLGWMRRLQQILGRKHQRNLHVCNSWVTLFDQVYCQAMPIAICFPMQALYVLHPNLHLRASILALGGSLTMWYVWIFSVDAPLRTDPSVGTQFYARLSIFYFLGVEESSLCWSAAPIVQICSSWPVDYSRLCVPVECSLPFHFYCIFYLLQMDGISFHHYSLLRQLRANLILRG